MEERTIRVCLRALANVRSFLVRIGGKGFRAVLNEDKAPKTCDAIFGRLPINGKVIHAIWSGEAI